MYQMRVIVPANGTVTAGARRGPCSRDAPAHDTLRRVAVNQPLFLHNTYFLVYYLHVLLLTSLSRALARGFLL